MAHRSHPGSPLESFEAELAAEVYSLRAPHRLAELPAQLKVVAARCDGARTLAEVCAEARVSLTRGLLAAARLTTMGMIAPSRTGFTSLEEAFFASEVQPIDECDEPFAGPGDRFGQILSRLVVRLAESLPSLRFNDAS
jgi:hypothetical protein